MLWNYWQIRFMSPLLKNNSDGSIAGGSAASARKAWLVEDPKRPAPRWNVGLPYGQTLLFRTYGALLKASFSQGLRAWSRLFCVSSAVGFTITARWALASENIQD